MLFFIFSLCMHSAALKKNTCCQSSIQRSSCSIITNVYLLQLSQRQEPEDKERRESEGGWVGGKLRKRVQGCMSICPYTSLLFQELTSAGSGLNHAARKHTGGTECCRARVNGECKDGNQEWLDHFALVPPLCTVSACAAFSSQWLAKRGWTLPISCVPPLCPRRMNWLVNGGKVGQTSHCCIPSSPLWKSDSQGGKDPLVCHPGFLSSSVSLGISFTSRTAFIYIDVSLTQWLQVFCTFCVHFDKTSPFSLI